jgi:hypothetical protein
MDKANQICTNINDIIFNIINYNNVSINIININDNYTINIIIYY